jgi:curved DNA-binding protein CbpA
MARTRFDKDYYQLLELAPEAAEEDIRKAYRRLALRWHPDRNPGRPEAEERFKDISVAYAVLIDPGKRRDYDQARQAGRAHEFRQSRDDLFRDLFADPRASAVFEELVQEFERMGVRVHRQQFQQVLFGGRSVVGGGVVVVTPLSPLAALGRLARIVLGGASPREAVVVTPRRGLAGGLRRLGRWLAGPGDRAGAAGDAVIPLRLTRAEAEAGTRKRVSVTGGGRHEEVMVTVPPGVRAGTRLRLKGKGRTGPAGPRGDLYLAVEISDAR